MIEDNFVSGGRNKTHNNELYVRGWWEIGKSKFEWRHYDNGGASRKWFGNCLDIVNWSESAKTFYASHGGLLKDNVCQQTGISWNGISGSIYCFKLKCQGFAFSSSSPTIVTSNLNEVYSTMGLLNSCVAPYILNAINPTLQLNVGEVLNFPVVQGYVQDNIIAIVEDNIGKAKSDLNAFEISWDFQIHPLVRLKKSVKFTAEVGGRKTASYFLQGTYRAWQNECEACFAQLKANEEELNRIFIDIYGLQDELTPEVEDKDVTVRKADLQRDIKSLISYAVGCMFGRYSPLKDGLLYAGGDWDYTVIRQELMDAIGKNAFTSGDLVWDANFIDKDNILPICDDEYFEDDIVGRFINFISDVYGKDTLNENLKFIADALGGKGQPREVIRNYFLNDFYADHCKIYQKRPIYWLFDSGKKNGFKALIYMHRYQPDTIARIRTDYVHEQQARYRTAIADLEQRIVSAATSERVKLNKELKKLTEQDAELRTYEEKIHHLADQMISIDLDDGVKVNYAKFQDVLAKIK